jgi:hypothetical protein
MANRNDSDVGQHETIPGPGPGMNSSLGGANGMRPVEQMVDAAIERIAKERVANERLAGERESDGAVEFDLALYETPSTTSSRGNKPTRLRWKGLDVSDEFRSYAERVARGEDLPPFEGRVLAEPNAEFPWGRPASLPEPAQSQGRGSRVALLSSVVVVLALLGWSLAIRLEEPAPESDDAPSVVTAAVLPSTAQPNTVVPAAPRDVIESAPAAHEVKTPGDEAASAGRGSAASGLQQASDTPPPVHTAVAVAPSSEAAVSAAPLVPAATTTRTAAADPAVKLAPPGALEHAIGAVFAARAAGPAVAKPAPTTAKTADDFGILPATDPLPPPAATATPVAAKSTQPAIGNVGDLSRVGQPIPGAVRKEPGGESSAKGSLLVETPSF